MKQFAVLGLGKFGMSLAQELYELGHEVLVIERNEEKVQEIVEKYKSIRAIIGDATNKSILDSVGISNFDVVVVSVGNSLPENILLPLLLKEFGVKKVISKADDRLQGRVLRKIGADKIVYPERDMGKRLAHSLVADVLEHIQVSEDSSIQEIPVPMWLIGKSLEELALRYKYGINVLAIKHDEKINIELKPEDIFQEDDMILVMGKNESIDRLKQKG
jgi:trk system potassium uptake protein TrkA